MKRRRQPLRLINNIMKKIISIICALALLAMSTVAFAAGETTVWASGVDDFDLERAVMFGGRLYMFSYSGECRTWSPEDGLSDVMPVEYDTDPDENGYMNRYYFADEENLYVLGVNSASDYDEDEDTYSSAVNDISVYRLTEADGAIKAEKTDMVFEMDDMIESYDDYEYFRGINNAVMASGKLVFSTWGDNGSMVGVYDFSDESGEVYDFNELDSLFAIGDRVALAMNDYGEDGASQAMRIVYFDIETGETEDLVEMSVENYNFPRGFAADVEGNRLLYVLDGSLCAYDLETEESVEIGAISMNPWEIQSTAYVNGQYLCMGYSNIVLHQTDPDLKAETTIRISETYSDAVDAAFRDFTAAHLDVDVIRSTSYVDITQAMLNGSSNVDIYNISSGDYTFAAIKEKGYMAPLTSSEKITAFVDTFYPQLKEACVSGDDVVAVPLEVNISTNFSYSPDALAALGMTEDDLPKTWPEMIEFLKRAEEIHEANDKIYIMSPYSTPEDLRAQLIYQAYSDYMVYMDRNGITEFDTPELRSVLEGIDALDLSTIALMENYDDWMDFDYDYTLLETYGYVDFSSYNSTWTKPLPIGFNESDEPVITANATFMFVNAYSEHPDLCIEFIERMIDNYDLGLLTRLDPSRNEPIKNRWFEENIKWYDDYIESLRDTAEHEDNAEMKAEYEAQLAEMEEAREDYRLNNEYEASVEAIEWYRNYMSRAVVQKPLFSDEVSYSEFYGLITQYANGETDLDTTLRTLDTKFKMMLMEDM